MRSLGRRPQLLSLVLAAAAGTFCCWLGKAAFVHILHAGALGQQKNSRLRRSASGFSYGKSKGSGKGFNDDEAGKVALKKRGNSEDDDSGAIVKDESEGKSKALSTKKLSDLREKTLALRQKREAELDEYEKGKALIAKYGPKVAVMPEKVAKRAAKRGMVIGGAFYAAMIACVAGGIILYKTQDLIIPPTLMVFVTLALLALSILGSSYGLMSASWNPDDEGSVLGTEEFGENVKAIGEGFRKMSMQNEYEKAIELRQERSKLLEAKKEKKKELLNK